MENNIENLEYKLECFKNFSKKTIPYTKKFFKIAKNQKGKDKLKQKKYMLKWIEKNLYNIFQQEVENKIWKENNLPLEVKLTYISGIFIISHSKEFKKKITLSYVNIIKEIEKNIYQK